jgi:hypothetical protein
VIPHEDVLGLAISDPVTQCALPQVHGVGYLLGLAHIQIVDLVARRHDVLHLRNGHARGRLAKHSISHMQQPRLGVSVGAPEPGQHSPHDSEGDGDQGGQEIEFLPQGEGDGSVEHEDVCVCVNVYESPAWHDGCIIEYIVERLYS